MKKILLLFTLIPFILNAQSSTITAGTEAQVTLPNLSTDQVLSMPNPRHGSMVYDNYQNIPLFNIGPRWRRTNEALSNNLPGYTVTQPANPSNAIVLEPGSAGKLDLPQLTDAQIKAIVSPKTGSMVYDRTLGCVRYYDGELWKCVNQWKTNYPEALTGWKPTSDDSFSGRIALDPNGNIIMAGYFINSITIGSTTLSSGGIQQIFCAKYSPTGNVIWTKKITASNYCGIEAIAVGTDGSIYLAGRFTFVLDLGGVTIDGGPNQNVFLAKLDNDGNAIWAKNFYGDPGLVELRSLQLDNQNNPIITGSFGAGSMHLADSGITLSSGAYFSGFIAKYNYYGSFAWANALSGSWYTSCNNATTDASGNVYVAGSFSGSLSLPGGGTINSVDGNDIFISKYQNNGTFEWVKQEGTTANEFPTAICYADGKLLLVGITDNGTTIGSFTLPSQLSNTMETFYASLNVADQTWNWAFKADGYTYTGNVVMHNTKEFYLLGTFTNQQITTFGNKSVWGDGGAAYIVKGNMSDGSIKYFRKMYSEGSIQDIIPLSDSKKAICGNSQYPVKLGDRAFYPPGNNFQSFIGIITE